MFLLVQRESIDLALAITFHVHITDVYSGFNADIHKVQHVTCDTIANQANRYIRVY